MAYVTSLQFEAFLDVFTSNTAGEGQFSLSNVFLVIFQFPILCSEFFKLTTYVCEVYPAKISLLPEALFKNLMASLEVGLTKYPFRNTISYLSLWENCFRRFPIYVLCFISFEVMKI